MTIVLFNGPAILDELIYHGTEHNFYSEHILYMYRPFQSIKTGVLLIFSFITGDKIEFLPPMMFLNEYMTGI